ncbi:hypothetical protein IBTHAUMO2_860004 [Nitrosopumilaceae archaeon]|nr:hypothetical protein IBTHAUMO2_860004 [Nitrosopumilaceae archaeon]
MPPVPNKVAERIGDFEESTRLREGSAMTSFVPLNSLETTRDRFMTSHPNKCQRCGMPIIGYGRLCSLCLEEDI